VSIAREVSTAKSALEPLISLAEVLAGRLSSLLMPSLQQQMPTPRAAEGAGAFLAIGLARGSWSPFVFDDWLSETPGSKS